jgi:P27 family predicted phage terminase small subunit
MRGKTTRVIPDPIAVGGRVVSIEAPADLEPDECSAWLDLVPHLERSGLLDRVDEVALRHMVLVVAAIRGARAQLVDEGWYVSSPNGYRIAHPAVGVLRQFLAEFRQWSNLFGLDPASRAALVGAGVKSPVDDEDDEQVAPTKLRAV